MMETNNFTTMTISYKNKYGGPITKEQALVLDKYIKVFSTADSIKREETFYKGKFNSLTYYKDVSETQQTILNTELTDEGLTIRETVQYGDYRLEKDFYYNNASIFQGHLNSLYDPNNFLVGQEYLDENGRVNYQETFKYYYDMSVSNEPDDYIFICTYSASGSLKEIRLPNEHIDPGGQESELYGNSPTDIQEVMGIAEISQTLMDYYESPNVIPKDVLNSQ